MRNYRITKINEDLNDDLLKAYSEELVKSGVFTSIRTITPSKEIKGAYCIYGNYNGRTFPYENPRVIVKIIDGKIVGLLDNWITTNISKSNSNELGQYEIECINPDDERVQNVITSDGNILLDKWYDEVYYNIRFGGCYVVEDIGGVRDPITKALFSTEGKQISDWFKRIEDDESQAGFIVEQKDGRWNILTEKGLVFELGYDSFEGEFELESGNAWGNSYVFVFHSIGGYYFFNSDFEEIETFKGNSEIINYEHKEFSFRREDRSYLIIENSNSKFNVLDGNGIIFDGYYSELESDDDYPLDYIMAVDNDRCQYYDMNTNKLLKSYNSDHDTFKEIVTKGIDSEGGYDYYLFAKTMEGKCEIYSVTMGGVELESNNLDGIKLDDEGEIIYVEKYGKTHLHTKENDYECDYAWRSPAGFFIIYRNGKYGLVEEDKDDVEEWFDDIYNIREYIPVVKRNGKYNFIYDREILFDDWFDDAKDPDQKNEEFEVMINGEWKKIDLYGDEVEE